MNAQANVTKAANSNKRAPRAKKEVAPVAEVAPAIVEVSNVDKALAAQAAMIDAINARIASAPTPNFAKNMSVELREFSSVSALRSIEKCIELEVDFVALAASLSITNKSAHDYIAIYAMQKIRKAVYALACGITREFDGYTYSIVRNLVTLQTLSNKDTYMSLSNKIVFDEMDQIKAIKQYKNCDPSTASTQASSTRQMLRFLNICNVVKSKKDDAITLKDTKAAKAIESLFASA